MKERILCVDDEVNVLEGLRLVLGRTFDVVTAVGGTAGVEAISSDGPFVVVLSDMRMPGMNGAEFLAQVRELAPDTTRMLLTGQSDLESAIDAVNRGQVFRFLTKPCAPPDLLGALEQGVRQYQVVTAEREILEKTLVGSVSMLHEVLALASPEAFGRASRVKRYVMEMGANLTGRDHWELETAAMLSQVGLVTLNPETLAKLNLGQRLTADEERAVAATPSALDRLLAHIPRMEGVRAIIAVASQTPGPAGDHLASSEVARRARLLRIALEFDRLEQLGVTHGDALRAIRSRFVKEDPSSVQLFCRQREIEAAAVGPIEISLMNLRVGMIFAEDVRLKSGMLLAPKGFVVTAAFVERVQNIRAGTVVEPVVCHALSIASGGHEPRVDEHAA